MSSDNNVNDDGWDEPEPAWCEGCGAFIDYFPAGEGDGFFWCDDCRAKERGRQYDAVHGKKQQKHHDD